ncbi:NRDE family protein [Actinocrinis puniceicyclus]|uniref:NRDE family protein n=1 Tax=Actinocrinis puniceicyclus TaxID=977794 RepID=UPI001FED0585|nr:NRDE family protein [Actinocrinis puniceicyclus]
MCTTVIDIDPRSPVPVLLIGVRDEFGDRPWLPPGRHWSGHPALVGGQDLQALGTWLAVAAAAPRVACVLNAHGEAAAAARRSTRGGLPLRAAESGDLGDLDAARYDPFHLVCASPTLTRLWSWNGRDLTERTLDAGLHIVVNSGLDGAGEDDAPGGAQMRARIEHFRPLFDKAPRPEPRDGSARRAWGAWFGLAAGGGLDPRDPRALVLSRTVGDRPWGTSSVSLVALTRSGARFDFCADPAGSHPAWSRVL